MAILTDILVILHFVGLASLLGGFLLQTKAFKTTSGVINVAGLPQLVTFIRPSCPPVSELL